MKHFLILIMALLFHRGALAETFNMNWYVDNNTYAQTTCESGGDIILPGTPTKHGYDFKGWVSYTPIEYLESTGTQCIDTNYIVSTPNTKVEIVFYTNSYYDRTLYAWNKKGSDSQWMVLYNNTMYIGLGSVGIGLPAGEKNTFIFETGANSSYEFSINNTLINQGTYGGTFIADPTPVYILCQKTTGAFFRKFSAKVYSFKLWADGVLVRDFIPVLDNNNVPCMFDRVTEQFFYNQGTGDFIAGPSLLN